MKDASATPGRLTTLGLAAAAGAAFWLRWTFCLQGPHDTGDLARHLIYGQQVREGGLHWAAVTLKDIHPVLQPIPW